MEFHDLFVPKKGKILCKLVKVLVLRIIVIELFDTPFSFSMTFGIFLVFHDFSRPGNTFFKFHDFSRFSMTAQTLIL